MNKTQWIANLVLVMAGLAPAFATSTFAQTNVAIVDIGVVFEKHAQFQQQLDQLRTEAEALQNSVTMQRQKLAQESESLGLLFAPTTAEYKQREKDLALQAAQLDLDARDKMRDLMTREAHIHYDTYNEINRYIEEFCVNSNIRLVLRHSGGEMKSDNPDSIMEKINGAVVYFRPEKDVTEAIVQKMLQTKSGTGSN